MGKLVYNELEVSEVPPRRTEGKPIVEAGKERQNLFLFSCGPWATLMLLYLPDLIFLFENFSFCLPSTTCSWFIVSQAKSHLFAFMKYLLKNFLVLPGPFSTPLVKNKGSSTLHSPDSLISTANVLMVSISTYICEFYITSRSLSQLQIVFHSSSPAFAPAWQVPQSPPEGWTPHSARQGYSSDILSPHT